MVDGEKGADPLATPATYIFDARRTREGYRLNKMCMSLVHAENRETFRRDQEAYFRAWNLSERDIRALRERNWLELIKHGGNIYMLIKVGNLMGDGLYSMGAQMRGETLEQFLLTRAEEDAR
jgi:protocatechuate 4,5-dioxygenase, alpha chain